MKTKIYGVIALILLSAFAVNVYIGLDNYFTVRTNNTYPLEIIITRLQASLDTNNVEQKIWYIETALEQLEPYTGNSAWYYPTERTDIDITKRVLNDTAKDVKKQIPIQDKENWMILPHPELDTYLNKEITNGIDRVQEYASAEYFNFYKHPISLISLPISAILVISFSVFAIIFVDRNGRVA